MGPLTPIFLLLIAQITFCAKPNVIIIIADDIGWDDVSYHGSTQVKTPNIDKMAGMGVQLDSHYVSPLCSPSRASLLTGRYPAHLGLQHSVLLQGQRNGVPLNETLLSEYLREQGYATHAVGKWHLGYFAKEYTPSYRGFDSFYGYYNENMDYWDHTSSLDFTLTDNYNPAWGNDWHFDENGQLTFPNDFGKFSADILTDRAVKILQNYSSIDQPLFLYLAYQNAHSGNEDMPLQAPQEDINEFPNIYDTRRRTTAGNIFNMDKNIGRVLTTLQDNNYMDNSIVLFMSDNGGPTQNCDFSWASNYPLRGSKHTLYEGGVRGVAFAYAPNIKNPGSISGDLMHISDWVPTVLEATGAEIPSYLDGVSQYWTLVNGTATNRVEVLHNLDQRTNFSAIRNGAYKLIVGEFPDGYGGCPSNDGWYSPPGETPTSSYVNENSTIQCGKPPLHITHKCKSTTLGTIACMYNIAEDPCEHKNLIDDSSYKEERDYLFSRLNYYWKSAVPARFPMPDIGAMPGNHDLKWCPWTNDTTLDGGFVGENAM